MLKNLLLIFCINLMSSGLLLSQTKYESITWKKFQSSGPQLIQIGKLETKTAKEVEASPWSVGCETLDRDYGDFNSYKEYVGQLGVKHGRVQSGWAKCEKVKGIYNFGWLDTIVYGLLEEGVEPWISLSYGNPLYKSEFTLGAGVFTDKSTMNAWLKYVEATVERYKNVVHEWEIWNEPNHRESPEAYANLLINTIEVVKKVQPKAIVMGFTVHGFSPSVVLKFPESVLEILKDRGKTHLIDYATYHPYTPNPDDCYGMVEDLGELMRSYNPNIKLYQGESGCPSILEWGHAMNKYPWTEYSQVKWVLRRMAGDRLRDIRSSIFTIQDLQYESMLQSFGLLRSNTKHEIIYKRPSFYAVQHMASFFDGEVETRGELNYESPTDRSLAIGGFKKQGSDVVLIWQNDEIPTDEIKWDLTDITIKDVDFLDPVYVEMITGKVYDLTPDRYESSANSFTLLDLPIWDSPIMITDRSLIELK